MTDDGEDTDNVIAASDLSSFIREKSGTFRVKFATGTADASPSAIKKFALFRLAYDLYECRKYPLPMISAEPLDEDTNMWEWHANLMGPPQSSYEDICFHFKMKFPMNYPAAPPKIEICSMFEHPNVFGRWICLDMLQGEWVPDDPSQTTKDIGTGWTPAYTVQSILVQLQAFLFDSVDTTYWSKISEKYGFTNTMQQARRQAKIFKLTSLSLSFDCVYVQSAIHRCKQCAHCGKKPWPEPEAWRDRLRYMVPGEEMPDIGKIRQVQTLFLLLLCVHVQTFKNIQKHKKGILEFFGNHSKFGNSQRMATNMSIGMWLVFFMDIAAMVPIALCFIDRFVKGKGLKINAQKALQSDSRINQSMLQIFG